MDGEEAEDGVGDEGEATEFAVLALRRWIQKSPAERTFIRPGAAGKLEPPPRRPRHRGAEEAGGEAGGREAAAAAAEAE